MLPSPCPAILGIIGVVTVNQYGRPKFGNALYGAYAQDFLCADGRRVMVAAITPKQWEGFAAATGMEEEFKKLGERLGLKLKLEGDRFKVRAGITELLAPWFKVRNGDDFPRGCNKRGITWSVFRSFGQVVAEDRGSWLFAPARSFRLTKNVAEQ